MATESWICYILSVYCRSRLSIPCQDSQDPYVSLLIKSNVTFRFLPGYLLARHIHPPRATVATHPGLENNHMRTNQNAPTAPSPHIQPIIEHLRTRPLMRRLCALQACVMRADGGRLLCIQRVFNQKSWHELHVCFTRVRSVSPMRFRSGGLRLCVPAKG